MSICSISSETSLESTSKILVTMMCLLSQQTSQTLVSLSTDCMLLISSGSVFCKSKLFKTSCPKSQQQSIEFKTYPHNVSLCIVALVKLYLDKAAAPRNDVNSKFFISYALSHKPVSARTQARRVPNIFSKADINTKNI